MTSLDRGRIIETAQTLIATPSVNPFGADHEPGEGQLGATFAELLRDAGCDVTVDEVVSGRPNVVASLGGETPGPTVMLAGHLDTVGIEGYDEPFNPRLADGRLHGRGACDMKGALATFIDVARVMNSRRFAGTLLVAGISDEEDLMLGSRHWAAAGRPVDYAIVGEPTGLAVCPAHKGQIGVRIRTHGRAVHSSICEEGVNAIDKMAAVVTALHTHAHELTRRPAHPLLGTGRCNVGVIRGGDILSTVPDLCEIEVDRRTVPGDSPDSVMAEYRALLDGLAQSDPDFQFELEGPTVQGGILNTPADSPVVLATASAVDALTGAADVVRPFPAATDAPNFGCHAVICGPGSLAQAHSLDEWVDVDELLTSAEVYLSAVTSLLVHDTLTVP